MTEFLHELKLKGRHMVAGPTSDPTDGALVVWDVPEGGIHPRAVKPSTMVLVSASQGPFGYTLHADPVTWALMPAAESEVVFACRYKLDLTTARYARISASVALAAFAGATLKVKWTDDESSWTDLTSTVAIDSAGTRASGWVSVLGAAQHDLIVGLFGAGGNGILSPQFRGVMLQVK